MKEECYLKDCLVLPVCYLVLSTLPSLALPFYILLCIHLKTSPGQNMKEECYFKDCLVSPVCYLVFDFIGCRLPNGMFLLVCSDFFHRDHLS